MPHEHLVPLYLSFFDPFPKGILLSACYRQGVGIKRTSILSIFRYFCTGNNQQPNLTNACNKHNIFPVAVKASKVFFCISFRILTIPILKIITLPIRGLIPKIKKQNSLRVLLHPLFQKRIDGHSVHAEHAANGAFGGTLLYKPPYFLLAPRKLHPGRFFAVGPA